MGLALAVDRPVSTSCKKPRPTDPQQQSDSVSQATSLALLGLIDTLEQGIVLTDACARVLFLNRAARQLAVNGGVRFEDDWLRARTAHDTAIIHRVIKLCAVGTVRTGSVRLQGVDGNGLLVIASSIQPDASSPMSVALLLIDPARIQPPDTRLLREQFGLTAAEAALAADILCGDGLAASAARRNVKLSTTRTHLQRVFQKTGTCRQAELVRLLLLCRPTLVEAMPFGLARGSR